LREKEKTKELALIRRLEGTILTIQNTKAHLNKSVTELSEMLREEGRLKTGQPERETALTFTMLDRYLKAGATSQATLESFQEVLTEAKNSL